jgi:hypothetical protein
VAAHAKFRTLDILPQPFEMIQHVGRVFPGEQDIEFFSTAAVSAAASSHASQIGCNQAQDLIAGVVSVGVVEPFEVIDVDDGNGIGFLQSLHGIVEGAPRR